MDVLDYRSSFGCAVDHIQLSTYLVPLPQWHGLGMALKWDYTFVTPAEEEVTMALILQHDIGSSAAHANHIPV